VPKNSQERWWAILGFATLLCSPCIGFYVYQVFEKPEAQLTNIQDTGDKAIQKPVLRHEDKELRQTDENGTHRVFVKDTGQKIDLPSNGEYYQPLTFGAGGEVLGCLIVNDGPPKPARWIPQKDGYALQVIKDRQGCIIGVEQTHNKLRKCALMVWSDENSTSGKKSTVVQADLQTRKWWWWPW